MLVPLLIAAAATLPTDTLLVPGVSLLGELVDPPVVAHEEVAPPEPSAERIPFGVYASMPVPQLATPGVPPHETVLPTDAGFTWAELDQALSSIEREVYRGGFPGAAVAVGRWDTTVLERGIGTHDWLYFSPQVNPDYTIYDLASLTKVVATTTAVMLLVEDGIIGLEDPVSKYLPAFSGGEKDWVKIRHLLTHSSGLPAWANIAAPSAAESLRRAIETPLVARPASTVEYSDIGFVVLWAAAEAAYGGSLEDLLQQRVYEPLGMYYTRFMPGESCMRCAPTAEREGFRGVVHDPIARHLGGVTGNAGLFSTAHDLARFAAMLVNNGELDGVRVLESTTIEQFTQRQPGTETRALGWDTPDEGGRGAGGLRISRSAFGHTGFTGTSLWVDPERGTWTVLLSNRTYEPRARNRMQALRRQINDFVAVSVDRGRGGR